MPMTHIPEISTKSPYKKTGSINRQENRACPIHYQKKFGRPYQTCHKLVPISSKCAMGITSKSLKMYRKLIDDIQLETSFLSTLSYEN